MLTLTQQKTYAFIQQFFDQHGYSPTASEIAEGIGIKSRGVVHRYLKALTKAKKIILVPNRHRNIQLCASHFSKELNVRHSIPLLGVIAAGQPIEAVQQNEKIDIAAIFSGENHYALKVKGDSMIDEGIFEGDIVICQKAETAKNGQIVVALIDHEEATLKRFEKRQGKIALIPANAHLKTMLYPSNRVEIQGIYVGLLRY